MRLNRHATLFKEHPISFPVKKSLLIVQSFWQMPRRLVFKILAVLLSQAECLACENMGTRLPDATYR